MVERSFKSKRMHRAVSRSRSRQETISCIPNPQTESHLPANRAFGLRRENLRGSWGITIAEFVNGLHIGHTLLSLVMGAIIPNRFEREEKKCPFILIVVEPVVCN